MKKAVVLGTCLCLCVPFVFIKSFFPFYRFGMFAEPVKTETQTEQFYVYYQIQSGSWKAFEATAIGLNEGVYGSIVRKHVYQNQAQTLLQKTGETAELNAVAWQLWQVIDRDSSQIAVWKP